ncbi:MAG: dihydrolipoyl dehydrogenase [Candidatus Omnitrophica bacterium]|nr:dihydrolipoyl dehydrogenase [Candidatus Omnitrophota bacterium]
MNTDKNTQLLVIGGGPGGYPAAFLAADLGMEVTIVDINANPGGVCLYRGCIPSKALLHAAKVLSESRDAKELGIDFGDPKIDIDKLRKWKEGIVNKLTGSLGQLSKQRKVTFIQGKATFIDPNTVKIKKEDGAEQTLGFRKAIIATGSRPSTLPDMPESKRILDSTTALDLKSIPETMLLVGGGYIGLELGTAYAEFGSRLDIAELLPQILTGTDRDLVAIAQKRLKTIFNDIMVETKVAAMEETQSSIKVTFEHRDGKASSKEYEKILVAIGRKPNSDGLGLENTKVTVNAQGFIEVDAQRQTADPSIYAVGDVTGDPMLAHKASHEGIVAAEAIAGKKTAFEPKAIPAVVFTDPEIAWCGLTETQAKDQGIKIHVAKFPWGASGRALTLGRTDGLTKLMIDPKTGKILGVAIVGPGAGEMIAEGVLAIEMGAVVSDLKKCIHPHPTLSETIMESAESFFGHATHIYKPKK